jgi:hypothetical protein
MIYIYYKTWDWKVQHLTERLIEMEQRLEREADARRKIQVGVPLFSRYNSFLITCG